MHAVHCTNLQYTDPRVLCVQMGPLSLKACKTIQSSDNVNNNAVVTRSCIDNEIPLVEQYTTVDKYVHRDVSTRRSSSTAYKLVHAIIKTNGRSHWILHRVNKTDLWTGGLKLYYQSRLSSHPTCGTCPLLCTPCLHSLKCAVSIPFFDVSMIMNVTAWCKSDLIQWIPATTHRYELVWTKNVSIHI